MRDRVEQLTKELILVFDKQPWYGDGVMEKLVSVTPEEAEMIVPGTSRSICQIVAHMVAWREYAVRKTTTDPGYKIENDSPVEWPHHEQVTNWSETSAHLKDSQTSLLKLLKIKNDDWLKSIVKNTDFDFDFLIQGIVHHDVYHLGQIGLLLRMVREQS